MATTFGLSCTKDDKILKNEPKSFEKNLLLGNWTLIKYADLTNCTYFIKPANISESVEINFNESDNVWGKTLANNYKGKYLFNGDSIKFIDLTMTLVLEPEWGKEFTNAIYNTDLVSIKNDTLVIYYLKSQKALIFSK